MDSIRPAASFLFQRLFQMLLVMLAILAIAFAIRSSLGDPVREFTGQIASEQERATLREELGLNDPWPVQFGRYLQNAATGDLGTSYIYKRSTLAVIAGKFPASFELVLAASLIVVLLSIPGGIYCAVKPRSLGAKLVLGFSVLGVSVPVFLTGILLISLFSMLWGLLPAFGRGQTVSVFGWETSFLSLDGLEHLLLPAVTLSSIMLPLFIRLIRSAMLDELGRDYVRTARAKGVSRPRIWIGHALRNAWLPVIAQAGLQFGNLLAFTLLTEIVFQWPGMGFLFLEAVTRADIPLITTYLVVVGAIFVVTNTLADLASLALDPRISFEAAS
ncbi:MAG: ABC transporter permease [Methyloligella sp. ZOD6]